MNRALFAAVIFLVALLIFFKRPPSEAIPLAVFMMVLYIPMGYAIENLFYRRRMAAKQRQHQQPRSPEPEPVPSNLRSWTSAPSPSAPSPRTPTCSGARGPRQGLIVDPGEEAERILGAVDELGIEVEAILITHCHFDHIGAVAPVARATGAPVYCPEIEVPVLADIMAFVPWPGFGPYESYDRRRDRGRR